VTVGSGCVDETNIVPFVKTEVPAEVPAEMSLSFSQTAAKNNLVQWNIDGSPLLIDFLRPTLQHVIDGNSTYEVSENVYPIGEIHKVCSSL
jgi:hypothetical protein